MAVFAVYIKKEASYFGEVSPFGNTYHYKTAPGQIFDDQEIAEQLIELERPITQNTVKFTGWTTWGPTDGTKMANVIRKSGTANVQGAAAEVAGTYREVAALVVIPISRSPVFNRRRWLRKFIRVPGSPVGPIALATLQGSSPIGSTVASHFVSYGNAIKNIVVLGSEFNLCTEAGDGIPLGTAAEVRPYLFTRQIGQ